MSILNEDLSSIDIRNPLIPDGTVVEVTIVKEEEEPWKSDPNYPLKKGANFTVTTKLAEQVASDLNNPTTGEPVMMTPGKELKYTIICTEKDKQGSSVYTSGYSVGETYKSSWTKELKKYGAAFKGVDFTGSLDSFSRIGERVKARITIRESDNGARFNEIKNFVVAK